MYKIAIIEDMLPFQQELKQSLIKCFADHTPFEIHCFESGESFFSKTQDSNEFSMVFIDIELPGINGMETAKRLRESGYTGIIVFTTNHDQYVFDGYEVEAFRYLLKPIKEKEIMACINKLMQNQGNKTLIYSFNKKQYSIPFDEILYISSYGHYLTIHTEKDEYERKASMKALLEQLPKQFVRCHRSYIVNLDYLRKLDSKRIIMKNDMRIDVAAGYLDHVRKALSKSI